MNWQTPMHPSLNQQALAERFEAVFHNALDAICLHRDGRYILFNDAYLSLFGYGPDTDMRRLTVLDTLAPECRPQAEESMLRRKNGELTGGSYITKALRTDGSAFDMDVHISVFSDHGEVLTLAICRDVTADLAAARALSESEARMRTLFDSSPDPTWILQDNRFVECNRAAVEFLGYANRDELMFVHPSRLSPTYQPDGQSSFEKAEAMMALCVENGSHRFEWTHLRADGTEFLAEVTLAAITLQGKPAIHCSWRDITERRQAETQIQLAASVFHSTQEGILITDRNGTILSVNPAFTEITGYTAAEAVGQSPRLLKSDHHDASFYAGMWEGLIRDGCWRGEVWNRRKNGEAYLESLTITAISNVEGNHTRYVSVFTDITEIRMKDEQIRHQAYHDALTGLPNRALLGDRLEHALDISRRNGNQVAVLFLDLDRFKVVNDSLGHQAGDTLLQQAAKRIQDSVRKSDTVGRLGGDEFVVILTDATTAAEVAQVADKIITSLAQPLRMGGHRVQTGTSIGIAVFPQDGEDAPTLIKNADIAMYQAKSAARGSFRFFDASMNVRAVKRLEMESNLRRALEDEEFVLHYQPKVDSGSGLVVGAEALLRWKGSDGRLVPPGEFIPLAEETGLIIPMGYWVLEEVCAQLNAWMAAGLTPVTVSVNLSAAQFGDEGLGERIGGILSGAGIPPDLIEIELTESTVMRDPQGATEVIHRLRGIGLKVSMDDFGTGYSSLSHLKRLPISTIKIDRSFIADLEREGDDEAIIQAIVGLASTLRLDVVAEGVETEGQLSRVTQLGCRVIQGFYYGRPESPEDFVSRLGRKLARS